MHFMSLKRIEQVRYISKSILFGIAKNKQKSYTKKYASALLAYAKKSVKMYLLLCNPEDTWLDAGVK